MKYLLCLDFDETYFSHRPGVEAGIATFETTLNKFRETQEVKWGWITGNSLETVLNSLGDQATILPDFAATRMGSEIYWQREGVFTPCQQWAQLHEKSSNNITSLREELVPLLGEDFSQQPDQFQGNLIAGYYLRKNSRADNHLRDVEGRTKRHNLELVATETNPVAGDPADSLDIAIHASGIGKGAALDYFSEWFGIDRSKSIAIGDSQNDYDMFAAAGAGFLVANAPEQLRPEGVIRLNKPHCHGVSEALMLFKGN